MRALGKWVFLEPTERRSDMGIITSQSKTGRIHSIGGEVPETFKWAIGKTVQYLGKNPIQINSEITAIHSTEIIGVVE